MQKIGAAEVGGLGEERNEEIGEDMSDAMERRLYGQSTVLMERTSEQGDLEIFLDWS